MSGECGKNCYVLVRVRLLRYKGFADFMLYLGDTSLLVGPNNAGKTTLVQALRLAASLLRYARRRNARDAFSDDVFGDPRWVQGHLLGSVGARELSWFKDENLRHEFREQPTGLEVSFKNHARLRAIWPLDGPAFFYVEKSPGTIARTPTAVAAWTPTVGVVPTLVPVEHREEVLSADYVKESIGTRLTSRHFRNQLSLLRGEGPDRFQEFERFVYEHTPEITKLSLIDTYAPGSHELDLYFTEASTHSEKEIYWAGDGLQIWLQVLLHIWRNLDKDVLVLDEPDVFLHPDLQRRLVTLLDEVNAQVVIATHAPEMLAEAARDSVIWVDRTLRRSRRPKATPELARLTETLGSGFNLGLARALRSKAVLFVEGKDMKVLRNLARAAGTDRVRAERGLAVVALGGFSNWHQVEPFAWLSRDLLGDSVKIYVVLDRDYRPDEKVHELQSSLADYDVHAHVWRRKELESYLLIPEVMARVTGLELALITDLFDRAVAATRVAAQANFVAQRQQSADRGVDPRTVMLDCLPTFEQEWTDQSGRVSLAPPKDVLSEIAREVQSLGGRSLSVRGLSANVRHEELDQEVIDLLVDIEATLSSGS